VKYLVKEIYLQILVVASRTEAVMDQVTIVAVVEEDHQLEITEAEAHLLVKDVNHITA
jgi:hypothetical protein